MKTIAIMTHLIALTCAFALTATARQNETAQSDPQINQQQLIAAYYIGRIQPAVGLSNEQYVKVIPFLQQYLTQRRQRAVLGNRALVKLRQAVQRKASDDAIDALVAEFDRTDTQNPGQLLEEFHAHVDPLLTATQRAKLRAFQVNVENQLAEMILRARGGTPPPPKLPTP